MKVSQYNENRVKLAIDHEDEDFHMMVPTEATATDLGLLTRKAFTNLFISSKCKLMGAMYNIVHSTPTEVPSFSRSSIYMLGKRYDGVAQDKRGMEPFLNDFYSILWFTYRKDFAALEPSQLTTDIGWGCMLRTGQMLVAQALVRHILGRDWQLTLKDQTAPHSTYRQILRWFGDTPSSKCPYSIHNIVHINRQIEEHHENHTLAFNRPGEWFSPTRVCKIIKYLVRDHSPEGLTMHVAKEGVVYRDKIASLCTSSLYQRKSPKPKKRVIPQEGSDDEAPHNETPQWRPLVILIPLRLGVDRLNKLYIPVLKEMFCLPQSIGIIGGRPKQSLYFVGFQDDQVIYLDPHIVRPAAKLEDEFLDTYHCNVPRVMPFDNVDPSLALGFYCADQLSFEQFCYSVNEINSHLDPIFTIEDVAPTYSEIDSEDELSDIVVV